MFETKGRLKVSLLVVGVLVVSLGMYADFQVQDVEAHPHPSCSDATWQCCYYISRARTACSLWPGSVMCADEAEWANVKCSIAAAVCGTFSCSGW